MFNQTDKIDREVGNVKRAIDSLGNTFKDIIRSNSSDNVKCETPRTHAAEKVPQDSKNYMEGTATNPPSFARGQTQYAAPGKSTLSPKDALVQAFKEYSWLSTAKLWVGTNEPRGNYLISGTRQKGFSDYYGRTSKDKLVINSYDGVYHKVVELD